MLKQNRAGGLLTTKRYWVVAVMVALLSGACSKPTDQELWNKLNAAIVQEKDDWSVKTLGIIHELVKRKNGQVLEAGFMDRMTSIVTAWIDASANWVIEKDRAAAMEKVLRQADPMALLTSLGRKLKDPQSRVKALALAEKLKISGREPHFTKVLSEQGDQLIAEDFLYSGNKTLFDAGKQWLEKKPKAIDNIVFRGASFLSEEAEWVNVKDGKRHYDILKTVKGEVVVDSLARHVLKPDIRLRALFLGVKLGIPGTEERLNDILVKRGDKRMAEDFLNAGSQKLYDGGREWANAHGYHIMSGMGSHRVRWGAF
jgi:hypothetical protein